MLRCGRGGIRTPGTLSGTPVFKTGAINQLCHSSFWLFQKRRKSNTFYVIPKHFYKKIAQPKNQCPEFVLIRIGKST